MSAADTTSSSPDLEWLLALLWPHAVAAGSQPGPDYGVISRRGRPKLIVPLDAPRAAAAAINRTSGDVGAGSSFARRLGGYGLRTGLMQPFLRNRWTSPRRGKPPSLEDYLREALGVDRIALAVTVGPPRPNRKPVIEILSPDGETIGYAKVGWNGLTRHLVGREAANLENLDRVAMPNIEAPRVLHRGVHGDLDILVLSPLSQPPHANVRRTPTVDEVGQVATIVSAPDQRLETSPYAVGLRDRIATRSAADAALLSTTLERACGGDGGNLMRFGGWHGDWTPWNMLAAPTRLLVWDWERAGGPVPLGLDAIHYSFQSAWLREGASAATAIETALDRSRELLIALGVPTIQHHSIGLLYLSELFLRYAENADYGTDQLRAERKDDVRATLAQWVGD